MNHTPTPWTVRKNPEGDFAEFPISEDAIIDGSDNLLLAQVSDKNLKDKSLRDANAAFIVRACNSHEKLVDAVKTLLGHYCVTGNDPIYEVEKIAGMKSRLDALREALSEAEEMS